MDTDLLLSIGIVLVVLTLPSLLSAWTEGRAPRFAMIMLVAASALIITALTQKPGGYSFSEIPGVMLGVVGRYTN